MIVKRRLINVVELIFFAIIQKRALFHHINHSTHWCFYLCAKDYLLLLNIDIEEINEVNILTNDHVHLNDFNWIKRKIWGVGKGIIEDQWFIFEMVNIKVFFSKNIKIISKAIIEECRLNYSMLSEQLIIFIFIKIILIF